ncbi:MAG: crossover junction endodeoxyribonuclease RuvC [Bacteroidaceae bacterium]|nr:crossover junction endodeoxyribonuclease RuvC [Bacteroidaceae bacterium]
MSERVILGIDPGTNVLGYGVLRVVDSRKLEVLAIGVIDLRKCVDVYLKLGRIYERVSGIIDSFHPDELAIEAPFFGKNVQSMLKLGRAQGVTIAAAMARQVPIAEYAPLRVKQNVTGSGSASKEQVAELLKRQLSLKLDDVKFLDATDALAVAYCHYLETSNSKSLPTSVKSKGGGKSKSWADFAKNNADRIRR